MRSSTVPAAALGWSTRPAMRSYYRWVGWLQRWHFAVVINVLVFLPRCPVWRRCAPRRWHRGIRRIGRIVGVTNLRDRSGTGCACSPWDRNRGSFPGPALGLGKGRWRLPVTGAGAGGSGPTGRWRVVSPAWRRGQARATFGLSRLCGPAGGPCAGSPGALRGGAPGRGAG